jgi:hypothetical protein
MQSAGISGPALRTSPASAPAGKPQQAEAHPKWPLWHRRGLMLHNRDRAKARAFAETCHRLMMNGNRN